MMNSKSIVFLSKAKPEKPVATVEKVFHDFIAIAPFPDNLVAAKWVGSRDQIIQITEIVTAKRAHEMIYDTKTPTISYLANRRREWAGWWWAHLIELEGGPDPKDKSIRKAVDHCIKSVVDAVAHKSLTGHDLPKTKDAYVSNPLQVLRKATGHGDAAMFLYRIKYWWPRATIILGKRKWIAKTHKQWAEELGMEERTFRTAYNHLVKLDLIEAVKAEFRGVSINHIRPTEEAEKLFEQTEKAKTV